ncbi:transporter [bacterium]|nr:transporter [bacterium]
MVQILLLLLVVTVHATINAQDQYPEAIADNSFLIEEAYNQESRVVQHIFNGVRTHNKDVEFLFTQEWPLWSQRHQFSYGIPYVWPDKTSGFGDVMINYRYQLLDDNHWAVAPRISLILPTGKDELSDNQTGYQFNLPVSRRIAAQWAAHVNAGVTYLQKDEQANFFAGGSLIWLATPTLNLMAEFLSEFPDGSDNVYVINPGLRYAHNAGNLQIVPGLAVPIQLNGSDKGTDIFLYLSLEHPF